VGKRGPTPEGFRRIPTWEVAKQPAERPKKPATPKLASQKTLHGLGLVQVPDEEKVRVAIERLGEQIRQRRSYMMAMETCVKCGLCMENCHTFLGTRDPDDSPVGRADLIRKVWKRYFTVQGRLFGKLVGAEDLTLETINKWLAYFYHCTECRRCGHVCPFGIDTCEITMLGRQVLYWLGMVPALHADSDWAIHRLGNNMALTKSGAVDTVEFLMDEIEEERGFRPEFPVDKPDSDIVYVPSSADFMLNPDTLKGAALFFDYIGANWTITSRMIEAGNFGYLSDQYRTQRELVTRLLESAQQLGAKKIVWGECGHGWRAAKQYIRTMADVNPVWHIPIVHIHDEIASYIVTNQLELDPSRITQPVTLHDPCNYARACGHVENMRIIMRACVSDFREMYPNGEKNFCCGGGSGVLFDDEEMYPMRIKFSQKKAEQIRETGVGDGPEPGILCAPCSICKAQFYPMVEEHELNVEVKGLIDLVGKALVFRGKERTNNANKH